MNRLPTELWLYTLEKYLLHASSLHASVPDLTPDLKTLQACTLTCRSLRFAAQPLLFWKTTITVTDWDSEHNALQRVDFLLTLFHDFPGSSGWVRHLRIRDYSAESEHISGRGFHTMVSSLLPQMNLVQHLELYAIQLSTSAVTHILTLASVKTLDLTASSWDNILEPELRAELPSLVALTIKCYEENPTLPDVIFEQPRLQSLDLSGTVAVRLLCQSVENMLSRQASPILSNITSLAIGITGDTAFYQYLSHSDVLPHLVSVQGEAEFLSALLAGSRPIINVAIGSSDLRAVGIEDVRIALANCRQVLSLELYKMKRSLSFWPTLANLCPNLTVILIHYIIGDIMSYANVEGITSMPKLETCYFSSLSISQSFTRPAGVAVQREFLDRLGKGNGHITTIRFGWTHWVFKAEGWVIDSARELPQLERKTTPWNRMLP